MSNVLTHAERELDILLRTFVPEEEGDRLIIEEFIPEIKALVEKFGNSGQSGGSAPYTASAIATTVKKLCLFEPIAPITGEESEWSQHDWGDKVFQNNRCGAIFKEGPDGEAYYIDAVIWKGQNDWDRFSGHVQGISSRQYIREFPFKPKTFYVDVDRIPYQEGLHNEKNAVSCGDGDYVYFITMAGQKTLYEALQYYKPSNRKAEEFLMTTNKYE